MKYAILLGALVLSGCAGSGKLLREGQSYPLTFNSVAKTISTTVKGEQYNGSYVLNNSFGQASGFTGSKFTTVNVIGSATQGRALLTSSTGKVLRCEFAVNGMSAIGQCQDQAGDLYDLVTGG